MTERARPIHALTGIRFFAALMVVFYHYSPLIPYPFPLDRVLAHGPNAIGLFFALSGFILYYTYHSWFQDGVPRQRYWQFARARFARLYPMYLIALMLATPLVLHSTGVQFSASRLMSWLSDFFLVQAYLPNAAAQDGWNSPAWSISSECFFYAVFPFFIAFLAKGFRHSRALIQLLVALLAIEVATTLATCLLITRLPGSHPGTMLPYLVIRQPLLRVWEFFFGCVIGALFLHTSRYPRSHRFTSWCSGPHARNVALAGTMGSLLAVIALPGRFWPWKELISDAALRLPLTPLFGFLILLLANGPTILTPLLEHPVVLLLGEASYSLYITHWLVLIPLLQMKALGIDVPVVAALGTMIGSIVASIGWYKLVEMPARHMLRRLWHVPYVAPITSHSREGSIQDQ